MIPPERLELLQLVFHRLADPVDGEAAAAALAIRKFCVKEGVDLRDLQILPSDDHRLEWLQDIIAVRKRYRAHMDRWQKMEREHIRTIDDLRTQLNEAQATIDQLTAGRGDKAARADGADEAVGATWYRSSAQSALCRIGSRASGRA